MVNRAAQAGAGVDAGDEVEVQLALDLEERTVEVPGDLAAALERAGVRGRFDALSFSDRRKLVEWVAGAKRAETRKRRIAKTVEDTGKGRATALTGARSMRR